MRGVVTVTGKDKTGIIYNVSKVLAENNANIVDLSQTVLEGELFSMIMIIELDQITCDFLELKDQLDKLGTAINMDIRIQQEDIFNAMHNI